MKISQQVRRPLVGVALSMVAGLYLQRVFSLPALLLLALCAVLLSLAVWNVRCRHTGTLCLACLLLAAAYGAIEQTHTPARAALPVAEVLSSRQELIGTVTGDPENFGGNDFVTFRFAVDAVHLNTNWWVADSTVFVRMKNPGSPVKYGERWRLTGRYRSYDTTYSGIEGSFYTAGSDAERFQKAPVSFKGFCYALRHRAEPVFRRGIQSFPEHTRLLQALLLGYRGRLPPGLYQIFSRTGTLHIFAISGLHVGVMAAILIAALKLSGVSRPNWGLFLIPLLLLYVVSTGMKPSAFRAFTMAAVYFAAPLVRRRPDSVSAIALAAIILLLINPLQLGDPGFLLSFTVVSGIVMVHLYVARQINGFNRPGWTVPLNQLSRPHPLAAFGRTVALLALTSAAAWVFSVPLTAMFFNTVSPAALLANLAVIPLTFMIVLTGCFSLLFAPVWVSATLIFNHANRIFVSGLIAIIRAVEGVSWASYRFVRSPPDPAIALWYGGLVLLFAAPRRWSRAGIPLVLLAGLLWFTASPLAFEGIQVRKESDAAVLINSGSFDPVLVTKGDSYSLTRATRRLKKAGVNRLAVLALCGEQMDVEAVRGLCETFPVPRVWMLPELERSVTFRGVEMDTEIVFSSQLRQRAGDGIITVDLN